MNPNLNQPLQRAIDTALDAMSKANVLGAAASSWEETHGDMSGAADMAYGIRQQLLDLTEQLNQVQGHLTSAPAVPPQQAAKIPAKAFHPERVGDGLDALIEANDMLAVLETALGQVYIEASSTADAEIAGDKLIAIARRRIFDTMDVLHDVKGHLRSCKGGCDE